MADRQLLLASATTEIGVGGDIRTSVCAVERRAGRFTLEKKAPVISYGESADGVLATARRTTESPPNDQVLVLCTAPGLTLEATSGWDTLGFRGTCSLGFRSGRGRRPRARRPVRRHRQPDDAAGVACPVELGVAGHRRRRGRPGPALRADRGPQEPRRDVAGGRAAGRADGAATSRWRRWCTGRRPAYDASDDADMLSGMGFAIAMNGLKVSSSTMVVDIVGQALVICGIAGYREDSPVQPGAAAARRPRGGGHGQQRPDHRQQRPDAADPQGGLKRRGRGRKRLPGELFDSGLVLDAGVEGLYGRTLAYEEIVAGHYRPDREEAVAEGAVPYFPPVIPRSAEDGLPEVVSRPDRLGPHLPGGDAHHRLLDVAEEGGDWVEVLEPADVVLRPAACHPVYPPGRPAAGRRGPFRGAGVVLPARAQ